MKYKNFELNSENDSFLTLVDEEGNEELCQIIFTFESEELNRKYVIFVLKKSDFIVIIPYEK